MFCDSYQVSRVMYMIEPEMVCALGLLFYIFPIDDWYGTNHLYAFPAIDPHGANDSCSFPHP